MTNILIQLREAFDKDNAPIKNRMLKKAYDALEAQAAELTRLRERNAELEKNLNTFSTPQIQGELTHSRSCAAPGDWDAECTCGLEWRKYLQTEQSMSAAWRKRAEEAELRIASLEATTRKMGEALTEAIDLRVKLFRYDDIEGDTNNWSNEKVAKSDNCARKWLAVLTELSVDASVPPKSDPT